MCRIDEMLSLFSVVLIDFVSLPEVIITSNQTGRNQGWSKALHVAVADDAIGEVMSTTAHDGTPSVKHSSTIKCR